MSCFYTFRVAHCVTQMSVFARAKLFPDVWFQPSRVSVDLFLHTYVWYVKNDFQKRIIEGRNIFHLFPLRKLIASDLAFVQGFEPFLKSFCELFRCDHGFAVVALLENNTLFECRAF